jgi:4-amino-4-deoxy-L-arabinose transferase-like glycosyltransferase
MLLRRSCYTTIILLILILSASYFALFHRLNAASMHLWDESSYALNAKEMLERKNPIEIYLLGQPDLYNSKPPFAIWCMALSIHIVGFNELGVRLPSAFFGLFTVLALIFVILHISKNPIAALASPLVLISSTGFVSEHIARTGDTDCILAFWILAQSILFFLYTQSTTKSAQWFLLATGLAFSFGCLTKGIAGLAALPGLCAWILYQGKVKDLFTNWALYAGVAVFIFTVIGYYILRNHLTPGYIDAVLNFEVGGRLQQQEFLNPQHRPFYYFYQSMIVDKRLTTWIFVLPFAMFFIVRSAASKLKSLGVFFMFVLLSVSFFLAFSNTKLFWYDAPMYPLIAGVIGVAVAIIICQTKPIYILGFLAIFCCPYYEVVFANIHQQKGSHIADVLSLLRRSEFENDTIRIVNADPNFSLLFYIKQEELKGYHSLLIHPDDIALKQGVKILVEKEARDVDVNKKFVLDTLASFYGCNYYRIKDFR